MRAKLDHALLAPSAENAAALPPSEATNGSDAAGRLRQGDGGDQAEREGEAGTDDDRRDVAVAEGHQHRQRHAIVGLRLLSASPGPATSGRVRAQRRAT